MELRHIQYFVTVCDEGSVSRAAQTLHITQPNLSRQLRQFERDLGVDMFDRSTGRLIPTSSGRTLLPMARGVLAASRALAMAAHARGSGTLESLTIAAPSVTLNDIVAPFVATLGSEAPTIDVWTTEGTTPAALFARGADVVVMTTDSSRTYARRTLAHLPVWLQVPADHPWAGRAHVTLDEAASEPVILPPLDTSARRSWDAALTHHGVHATSVIDAASSTIAQALAAAGRGRPSRQTIPDSASSHSN
ncbi:LysR family transcriptional regulator [Nocardioides sambongensis]|uniref:LysR family transcriptional regulator n=1 Tax=Nocardioides sambongensis TaxID=2589074 RepID=UPI0018C8C027|nr:LysR family transcriptional regulator [Nocardioides sambongensis]